MGETLRRTQQPAAAGPVELPAISVDRSDPSGRQEPTRAERRPDLVAGLEIGRGGMGVVHLAQQRSLGREVAVKTSVTSTPSVAHALVREAQVMGGLEHPNIVPVHALGLDPAGGPVLVMKRIEGVSWRRLLDDREHATWPLLLAGHGDRLRANLEILMQVALALAYAHDRGVVHRDLKPENVMIGRFGEVYLLDWGVALRLSERDTEAPGIVGTPAYLAPEMTRGDPRLIDARTDVFLLGASLYELLTGTMPNAAPNAVAALVVSLHGSRPPLPAETPSELRELVEAALAREPLSRPANAGAFRERLARVLASREVDVLVAEAGRSTAIAARAIAAEGPVSSTAYPALVEARFALMTAAQVRPDDTRVRAELDACLLQLAVREIALRSPVGARAHFVQMSAPPASLAADVERLEQELEEERQMAEAGRRSVVNADISVSWLTISVALIVMSMLAFVGWLWLSPTGFRSHASPAMILKIGCAGFSVFLLFALAARRRIFVNDASRRITAFFVIWGWHPMGIALIQLVRGEAAYDLGLGLVAGLGIGAVGTIALVRQLWPTIPLHLLAIAAVAVRPEASSRVGALLLALHFPIFIRALRQRAAQTQREGALR